MTNKLDQVARQVAALAESERFLERKVEELARELRLARGTEDLTSRAAQTVEAVSPSQDITRKTRRPTEYFVGDEGPTPELYAVVETLLRQRPRSFQELLDLTGARPNRIKGVIVQLQRRDQPLINLGSDRQALWFIATPQVLERFARSFRRR